ncbi:MAG: hypothetical protein JOY58_04060 [Solirubrobacterales bacterium]|nr:hypothetical protein [Solirubrobacterales bacterium]
MLGRLKLSVGLASVLLLVAAPAASAISGTQYQWSIVRISAPYRTTGPWNFCAQSHGGSVTCSRGFTVANTVSGSLGVSDDVLSATLGYSVTTSTTLTGGATFAVPRHKIGTAQWRPLFATTAIHQRLYKRTWGCGRASCGHTPWVATNRYETAYASRYVGPDFREVIR